jgi:CD109 antigen
LAWYITGEKNAEIADTYFFTVPKVLKAGKINYIGYTIMNGSKPARVKITVELGDIRKELTISGNGKFELPAPNKEGTYKLKIEAKGFSGEAEVKVVKDTLIFIETDKPIYKPGQTVHIRLIAVNSMLRKAEDDVVVEILDAKGIKVFKKSLHVDGMTSIDFPLSDDPNLGVWKIRVLRDGNLINQLDFRVEKYVLPKYEIEVITKDWVLPDEKIKGVIEAKYVFGKPVKGEYLVEAYRYVGRWDKYAEAKGKIDGKAEFELPPVEYVVASPHQQAGGLLLNITVFEENTSYKQTVSKIVKVVPSEIDVKIIPEGSSFKPGIPFKILIVTRTQDGKLVDKAVKLVIQKLSKEDVKTEEFEVKTEKGKKIIELKPEDWVETITIQAKIDGKSVAFATISRAISKSFYLHIEKIKGEKVGDEYEFKVYYPQGKQIYYEVISKGIVLFTDFVKGDTIRFTATPEMAPKSKIVVYSFSGSEVVADYLTFTVEPIYRTLEVEVNKKEVKPREEVTIRFNASKVGVSIVDKSVFVLAENRLNLEEVFKKLEELYGEPRVEVHLAPYKYKTIGSYDVFENSGLVVLTNKQMTRGETGVVKKKPLFDWFGIIGVRKAVPEMMEVRIPVVAHIPTVMSAEESGLAEVKLVRQFFPETWFFGFAGNELKLKAPDTITTWAIHAVTLDDGLRIGSNEIRVFQPFFIKADFPYSIVRGEEVELKAVIYNYAKEMQRVLVTVEELDSGKEIAREWLNVSNIAEVRFKFKANDVGVKKFKITARSKDFADAIIKELRVVPEGVVREDVENVVVKDRDVLHFSTKLNVSAVPDSERYYLAISGSYMAQTISGLDRLIRMPFGCGEQNMILMAPGVYVAKYLIATNQMKPEIMVKAELMATVGYQRELTFMRSDGSFSAFGEDDKEGSTFLTAFVVRTFSEARDIIYIDDSVIERAKDWLLKHKRSDGSFETVGFVHHRDMMGGIAGDYAITAYVTISLLEAGYYEDVKDSIKYLERGFSSANNYSKTLACYALALAGKDYSDELLKIAVRDGDKMFISTGNKVTDVEATAYAVLALTRLNKPEAGFFVAWLVEQRNPNGGFYSTQDTVMAIKALTEYSIAVATDVDLTINVRYGNELKMIKVNKENADVTQIIELPAGRDVSVEVEGKGKAIVQFVKRYNVIPIKVESPIKLDVNYDTSELEEKGILRISVHYECSLPVEMTVIDVAVPTGFVPDEESLKKVECKRFEVADRKVIFYLDVQRADFEFYAKPVFVISSKTPLVSVAYSYYKPEVKAEVVKSVSI